MFATRNDMRQIDRGLSDPGRKTEHLRQRLDEKPLLNSLPSFDLPVLHLRTQYI